MSSRRSLLLPLLFFVVGATGTLALYLMIERGESRRLELETEILAEQVRLRLETAVDARVGLVRHLAAGQFEDRADIDHDFAHHAQSFIDAYPGIQALNYIDETSTIRIVVPPVGNSAALGSDLSKHPDPGVSLAFERASTPESVARTPIIDLLQGGRGFAVYALMVNPRGRVLGHVNGVFRLRNLVDTCLHEEVLRHRFSFRLLDADGRVAYSRLAAGVEPEALGLHIRPVRFVDRDLILEIGPNPEYAAESAEQADEVLAAVGLALVLGLSLLLRDVIQRQEALRRSRARYQLLVENQSDFVVQLDATGRLTYVSPSYCAARGRNEEDLLESEFLAAVHPDDHETARTALAGLENPPHTALLEFRVAAAGGVAWQTWSFSGVLTPEGRVTAVTAVGRDITRRRELEEKLGQSRKLQAVGQLAGGVAHEFNNLLQAMLGNLHFVVQDLRPTGQVAGDLAEIERGIERAMVLTRRLLVFGKSPGHGTEREDVGQVVADTVAEFRRSLPAGIEVGHHRCDTPLPARIGREALAQVVMSLCENAREAIPAQGTIAVTTGIRELAASADPSFPELASGRYAVITIRDDGRGMPAEVVDRVFEPFFTTRAFGTGAGLGLATSYAVIEHHEGTILVASSPGEGTEFTVLLPLDLRPQPATVDTRPPARPEGRSTETILLAEDDYSVRDLAVRVLRRANYEVLTAEDGREAVTVFTRHADDIDLVILDMVMPGLDGRETRDAIHALRPDVPILFASGFDPATLAAEHDLAPDEEVLAKPYGVSDLLKRVREILDRRLKDTVDHGERRQ